MSSSETDQTIAATDANTKFTSVHRESPEGVTGCTYVDELQVWISAGGAESSEVGM